MLSCFFPSSLDSLILTNIYRKLAKWEISIIKGYEETIDYFADLWKDDMIVKLRYPETIP